MIYLDNAATTKPTSKVCQAVADGLESFGNPSSLHRLGVKTEKKLENARETIAASIGCMLQEIYFTSGATESSNTAIFGAAKKLGKRKKRVVTTTVEHPSVAECFNRLENYGFEVVRIAPNEQGKIMAGDIVNAVDDNTFLVSCMLINNENGAILPVDKAFSAIKKRYPQVLTHCDCVQAYMKIPLKVKTLNADMISLSAHKIHGPKGIGAMYLKKGLVIPPYLVGGGQEKAFRSGTESIPLICGFSAAVDELSGDINERFEYVKSLQSYLFEKCGELDFVHVNSDTDCSPYVSSIAVKGLKSEVLLHYLEEREIYVSSGSACSKGKKSSVLQQFRVDNKYLDSTIRISFSKDNTKNDVDTLISSIVSAEKDLCKIH